MPRFELYDTVVIKAKRSLYGIVDRTHYAAYEHLDESLIIAHTQVNRDAITSFIKSGRPPKGHLFVVLADVSQGSVLVREDQVELIDRTFLLGDFVKRYDNPVLGTVIDFQETYVLQPVWKTCQSEDNGDCTITTLDRTPRTSAHTCEEACSLPVLSNKPKALPRHLIHNVPGEELKKATDLSEGDFVILDEWLGIVEDEEKDVILLLEDSSIVAVRSPDELYVPVPDFGGRPLVSIPEFDYDIPRPNMVVAQNGWSATVPIAPDDYHSGRLVITNHRNIRTGRWLRGHWHKDVVPQGRIIDSRSSQTFVRWLACNAYSSTDDLKFPEPPSYISLYENINTFSNSAELRRHKRLALLDTNKVPRKHEDRRRTKSTSPLPSKPHVKTPCEIRVGDQVKFRDQAGAALKYQGTRTSDGVVHGQFERISPWTQSEVRGFDVNALTVVSSQQQVTIRWQDGTVSKHASTALHKFDLFESDFAPSDLVASREGLTQRPATPPAQSAETDWTSYNEISVLEKPHHLKLSKVGIVQSIDSQERVARVRWFVQPSIRITGNGHVMSRDSRFGPLAEEVEDVSLYEILSFPALTKHLKDLVMLAPKSPSMKALMAVDRLTEFVGVEPGVTAMSHVLARHRLQLVRGTAAGLSASDRYISPVQTSQYRSQLCLDWVGEIVDIGIDGVLTVRVGTGDSVQDLVFEHDQIIAIVDESAVVGESTEHDGDSMDLDESYSDSLMDISETASTISETVEYEGGQRIDDDSDDANWEDAESIVSRQSSSTKAEAFETNTKVLNHNATIRKDLDAQDSQDSIQQGLGVHANRLQAQEAIKDTIETSGQPVLDIKQAAVSKLRSSLPVSQPPAFAVLDSRPPADQYQASIDNPHDSPVFVKRMVKEHRILASALPHGQIYVRTFESRLDLMRCLIIGPADTPYEFAPFVFDLQFTSRYPKQPPIAHFHSWTTGFGRVNPNLYEEGKICLSLLGTWQGKSSSESWSDRATILQLLVSLQGLVFVRCPFYNEAGYEEAGADDSYPVESLRYNEKSFIMTRAFVKHALSNTIGGLEDILAWTYLSTDQNNRAPQEGHHDENTRGDDNDTNTDNNMQSITTTSSRLLSKIIARSGSLIQKSEQKKTSSTNENRITDTDTSTEDSTQGPEKEQDLEQSRLLLDGAGNTQRDPSKAFLKPLSKGAIVMLTKTVKGLEEILDGF